MVAAHTAKKKRNILEPLQQKWQEKTKGIGAQHNGKNARDKMNTENKVL